jgi:putative DNA primase/helicase
MSLNKSDFDIVARAANNQIITLLQAWYPQGVIQKNEYCIGSIYGEAGQSMRVNIGDKKCGYWSDFAGDDSGTDLISLWAAKRSVTLGKACRELAEQLGVRVSDANAAPPDSKRITPKAPTKPVAAQPGEGVDTPPEGDLKPPKTPNWLPILPVPADAPEAPKAHPFRRFPDHVWTYRDAQGQVLGYVTKFTKSNSKKDVIPLVYAQSTKKPGVREWQWISFPDPRPLYLTGEHKPTLPVLITEGEKCADAADAALPDLYESVSWPGGCKAPAKADFTPLAGRHVILWPDCDAEIYQEKHHLAGQIRPQEEQAGWKAMQKIAKILVALGCRVQIVDIPAPGAVPHGYDIADIMESGGGRATALQWLGRLIDVTPPDEPAEVIQPASVIDENPAKSTDTQRPASASQGLPPSNYSDVRYQFLPAASGGVLKCRENVHIAMDGDEVLKGLVGLNRFTGLQEKLRTPPWKATPGEWSEEDDFMLGKYLAKLYGLTVAVPDIERGVAQAARDHAFNPVTDYLDACANKWDQVSRVQKAFTRYWGTQDSEYYDLLSVMFFVGLVARAYRPGCKNDYACVFEGEQGKGKSTALSILGGKWFADTPFDIHNKDSFLTIQGVWLYEIAELDAMDRATITGIKAFMSGCMDRFREPYARRMCNVLRTCAFGATTNQNAYFRDKSGNRRFWPVRVGDFIDLIALAKDRDQLFAEAVWMYRADVQWHPTMEEENRMLKPQQEEREIPDEWTGQIYDYLEGINERGLENAVLRKDRTTAREILKNALFMDIAKISQANTETMRIGYIMRKLGWTKKRQSTGAREWEYLRPIKSEAQNAA